MGRKKKGQFSREAILGNIEKDKKNTKESIVDEVVPSGPTVDELTLLDPNVDKITPSSLLVDGLDQDVEQDEDLGDEVFGDNVELEDLDELTRLMSVVDIIENDSAEFEKQLNLAGK